MTPRLLVLAALLGWAGSTLVLARHPWFARRSLLSRLQGHQPGAPDRERTRTGALTTYARIMGPPVRALGERVERLLGSGGADGGLRYRLARAERLEDPASFRLRQVARAGAALALCALAAGVLAAPTPVTLLALLGAPVLAALVEEHRLDRDGARRAHLLSLELPVVAEQLGMLLSAGYSLNGAMHRLAARGSGVCARGFAQVLARVHQGMVDTDALREWADELGHPGLDRLVAVACLDRDTGDLGHLISREARAVRRDVHRDLVEDMERRSQQVWIPVTIAALVPGAIFVAVPFLEALRTFSTST